MILVITGATGGIGQSIANIAVGSQSIEKIYCMYRSDTKLNKWVYAGHPKIVPVKQESSFPERNLEFMRALDGTKPKEIICIHTAFSMSPIKRVGTYLPEEILENITANVMGMVFLVNSLVRLQKKIQARLRIINIDSGAAYRPLEGWGMYSAAKAYTNMFLKSVQLENPEMRMVSFEPGIVDTPMQKEIRETDKAIFKQVELFREYYDKGMLHSPDAVAGDIFKRFVENWDGKGFREGYKTP